MTHRERSIINNIEAKTFFTAIQTAKQHNDPEKAVEHAVNAILKAAFKRKFALTGRGNRNKTEVTLTYPMNTDGLISVTHEQNALFEGGFDTATTQLWRRDFSVLVEAKRDLEFLGENGRPNRAKVAAQVVYYLNRFQANNVSLPDAVVIADMDEIFVLPTKFLSKYLKENYDWSIAPSSATELNPELYQKLCNDNNLNVHVEKMDEESFRLDHFCDRVAAIASNNEESLEKIRVDKDILMKAFLEFQRTVFGGVVSETKKQVEIFIRSLYGDENVFLNPNKQHELLMLHLDGKGKEQTERYPQNSATIFDSIAYDTFFTKYDRNSYSLSEQKAITEIGDTLFEDVERRFTGDFWTPKIWADEAHRLIEQQLGDDWKDKYVVWDPACGSKNLTRDYRFNKLYCSTLHQEELNIASDYNPEAISFQFNFLEDDMALHALEGLKGEKLRTAVKEQEWGLPDGLIDSLLNNEPIVFLGNPPYGQATSGATKAHKVNVSNNAVGELMKKNKIKGHAVTELYTQFIYRVQKLAALFNYTEDFFFFFFFNKGFLTNPSFEGFTTKLRNEFNYLDGFMLNAGEFQGTSSAWGIIFTGWELSPNPDPNAPIVMNVKKNVIADGVPYIENFSTWTAKTVDKNNVIDLLSRLRDYEKIENFPTTSNGFTNSAGNKPRSSMSKKSFGYLQAFGSTVQESGGNLAVFSMANYKANGTTIEASNFVNACTVFSIRKSTFEKIEKIKLSWVMDKNIFPQPTEEFQKSEEWESFTDDCVVYSLFATCSNQTSLRDYEYGANEDGSPRKWRINNEFFWLSKETVRKNAISNRLIEVEKDLDTDSERHVYKHLEGRVLSEESSNLLNIVYDIFVKSFKYRRDFNVQHPKFNLLTWDAGWAQIARMCFGRDALLAAKNDTELQALYTRFREARSVLGDKIAGRYSEDTGF